MKKLLSLLLAALMCFSCLAGIAAEIPLQDIPIITIPGTSNTHILNAQGETIVPDAFDLSEFIRDSEKMRPLLTAFGKAIVTDRWDAYCDMLVEELTGIWAPAVYDDNGLPQHGDHTTWTWSKASLPKKTSGFREGDYYFRYDWRMDPLATAQELDQYIDAVLEVTGAEKVAIVGRCYGACVAAAYVTAYGCGKIDNVIMYMPMALGVETEEALFTGRIALDAPTVRMYADYWLTQEQPLEDEALNDLLAALVNMIYYSGGLHLTAAAVENLVYKFKDNILPRLLRVSYGTYPGYWGMIGDEVYDEAKAFVFDGYEAQYAGLIEKIDRYHYTVQRPLFETLDMLQAEGMKVTVIAKYGVPTYPYFDGSDYLTDSSNSLTRQSFGATASTINTTLSEEYRAARTEAGYGAYLSADGKVDASTCRYPEQTWFFKDIEHLEMDGYISDLMTYSTQVTRQLTVTDDARYPQFMHKDAEGNVVPLTENDPSDEKWEKESPFASFGRFLRALLRILKAQFASLRE